MPCAALELGIKTLLAVRPEPALPAAERRQTTTTATTTTTTMDDTIDDASPASSVFEGEMVSWTTAEGDVVLGMSADEAAVWHEFATSTSTTTSGEAAPTTFTLSISYLDASPP